MSTDSVPQVPAHNTPTKPPRRIHGIGAVLVTVYAILAIGATSRVIYQFVMYFSEARIPITLSAISAVVYVVATIALIRRAPVWYRVAWVTISFELLGVLVIGTLSIFDPVIFAGSAKISGGSVWSNYGMGYGYVPVVLPVLGMLWLRRHPPEPAFIPAVASPVA